QLLLEGFDIFTGCGASSVQSKNGCVCLFTGWTQEVPLYYSIYRDTLYYHEQQLALPGAATLVERGQAVVWHPEKGITKYDDIEPIPRPPMRQIKSMETAISEYVQLIFDAVLLRIPQEDCRIALSQSGGLDSCLVAWALNSAGFKFTPLVACTSADDWDYQMAREVLYNMGVEPIPVIINPKDLPDLFDEAVLCYESAQADNLQMAIANIAIARFCQKNNLTTIFNGHAHDDIMGNYGLVQGTYKKLTGTEHERWRDARRQSMAGFGMEKMFSATFRHYGIKVQSPFFDNDLANWVFSAPLEIIPIKAKKPFARLVARHLLSVGEWHREVYNQHGYIMGAGFYEDRIRPYLDQHLEKSKLRLAYLKNLNWRTVAKMHDS
ncbi:MAG: hypothetical protein ICV85_05955, partial [Tolypothrix sp. T3-bin4]|nr:hypothetical protein [Tolypothrix sp. T3-bin4]